MDIKEMLLSNNKEDIIIALNLLNIQHRITYDLQWYTQFDIYKMFNSLFITICKNNSIDIIDNKNSDLDNTVFLKDVPDLGKIKILRSQNTTSIHYYQETYE